MPRKVPLRAKYSEYDDAALALLQLGPQTVYRVGLACGVDTDGAHRIFARLKSQGLITYPYKGGKAMLKERTAVRDPSPFPRPGYATPDVGWLG